MKQRLRTRTRSRKTASCKPTRSAFTDHLKDKMTGFEATDASFEDLERIAGEVAIKNLAYDLETCAMNLRLSPASDAPHPDDRTLVSTWTVDDAPGDMHIGITSMAKLPEIVRTGARMLAVLSGEVELRDEFEEGSPEYLASFALIDRYALAYSRDVLGPVQSYEVARKFVRRVSDHVLQHGYMTDEEIKSVSTYGWTVLSVIADGDRPRFMAILKAMEPRLTERIAEIFSAIGNGDTQLESKTVQSRFELVVSGRW